MRKQRPRALATIEIEKIGRSGKIGCRDPTPGVLIGVTLSVGFINDFKREPIRHHQSPTIEKKKETGKEGKMTADRPLRIVIPTPGPVTTMTYHMPTQPNPVWQSWWMFASPKSLQKEKRTIKWCNNSRMFASGCIPRSCAAFGDAVNGHQQWTVRKSSVGLCVVDLKDVEITILVRLMDLWNKEMCQLFYYTEAGLVAVSFTTFSFSRNERWHFTFSKSFES